MKTKVADFVKARIVNAAPLALALLLLSACSPFNSQEKSALDWKRGLFQRLQSNLSVPVSARIQKMPPDMLKVLQDYDQSIGMRRSDQYVARMATVQELALINSYIALLPYSYQNIFNKKLLAVYLVDGLSGAGLTDWVIDRDGHTYYYQVFNSSLLKVSLDDWLTYKENAYFESSVTSPAIRVQTNTAYKALMYGLLHEGAHIVDFELGVTPFMDPLHRRLNGRAKETSAFTDAVWLQRTQPATRYEFKRRGDLNVYGEFANKGLLPRYELAEMFSQLIQTPFVTFYSGTSWNEDFADSMTYQLIEKRLGGAVSVDLVSQGKIIEHYEPVKTPQAKLREQAVRPFFD
jgi:hypothetical protein